MLHFKSTPTRDRRTQRRLERQTRILDNALELIVEDGLEALTIQRLARRMDRAVGALYRDFASKDALLAELQHRVIADHHIALQARRATLASRSADAPSSVQALAQILLATRHYEALATEHPARFRLIALVMGDPRPLLEGDEADRVMAALGPLLADVVANFNDAANGALSEGDPQLRAVELWVALHGALVAAKLGRFAVVGDAVAALPRRITRDLLTAFGADPVALDAAEALLRTESAS